MFQLGAPNNVLTYFEPRFSGASREYGLAPFLKANSSFNFESRSCPVNSSISREPRTPESMAPSDFSTAGKGPGESDASAGRVKSSDVVLYSNDRLDLKQPYHVFDLKKKKQLVLIASLAGLFSPLSSNIYFPALDAIAKVC